MEVREINIHLKRNLTKWQKFLQFNGIEVFSEKETSSIDKTFVWEENGEILATGSIAGNVLKYIAICSKVTGIELDTLAHTAWKQEGVLGARMTGNQFFF